MKDYYDTMFKRKSFRQFKGSQNISSLEIMEISKFLDSIQGSFADDTFFQYEIVPRKKTTSKRGEYCILIYCHHDNKNLLNVGYLFSSLDLYLASINIGSCWYGMGKPLEMCSLNSLPFTIMMAIGKASGDEFRKNYKLAKRKTCDEISCGGVNASMLEYVKYSPSACNSQPWLICSEGDGFSIKMNSKEKMMIPQNLIAFYNTIDLGIILKSCDLWLRKNQITYKRVVIEKQAPYESGETVAKYILL